MNTPIEYTCSCCGQVHTEWPALAFDAPSYYYDLSEDMKSDIAELSTDFCVIGYPDETVRFIRGTLTIKVIDHCENLDYGVWVSLSEKSFENYSDNFGNPDHEAKYFGWLSNDVPDYEVVEDSIPTTVFTRKDGFRPEIVPYQNFDHPLVRDYYEGITKAEAERRIHNMLNR